MLHLRLALPGDLTDNVVSLLASEPTVSSLSVARGVGLRPRGDLVEADIAREHADTVLDRLRELEVPHRGTIQLDDVGTWLSKAGLDAEDAAPGSGIDAVVWPEVGQRAYSDSELNGTYLVFMVLATLIAAIAIVLDSQLLVIAAMVLGPEFGPIAALGLALVLRRRTLFGYALRTLLAGFAVAILAVIAIALIGRLAGWVSPTELVSSRPETDFIYHPTKWSFVVAVLAAVAGVVSLTSGRMAGIAGVFISVTTVPAAANIALGVAFWLPSEVAGSGAQLAINLSAMVVAGWATLAVRRVLDRRLPVSALQRDLTRRRRRDQLHP